MNNSATPAHVFGQLRGRCVFCGVHRDDPEAKSPCANISTPAGIITLGAKR